MPSAAASSVRRSFERPIAKVTKRSFSSAPPGEANDASHASGRLAVPFAADSATCSLMEAITQAETRARIQHALYPTLSSSPTNSRASWTTSWRLHRIAQTADPVHFKAAVIHERTQHSATSACLSEVARSGDAAAVTSRVGIGEGAISQEAAHERAGLHQSIASELTTAQRRFVRSHSTEALL